MLTVWLVKGWWWWWWQWSSGVACSLGVIAKVVWASMVRQRQMKETMCSAGMEVHGEGVVVAVWVC